MTKRNKLLVLFLSITTIILDQATKLLFRMKIPENGLFVLNQKYLQLQIIMAKNHNIAFGINISSVALTILLIALFVVLIRFILYLYSTKQFQLFTIFSIIFAGAISNIIDRILWGHVIDFISISAFNKHWPIFNIADIVITVSILIAIILIFKKEKKEQKYEKTN